jgi:UDP-GlcNAc:undecaprenyl-phosphate GlcNAc-1-phosphate transferase
VDARAIAAVHWGFAAVGGVVALAFTHAGPAAKLPLLLALLVPQLAWLGFVVARARAAGLGRW